MLLFRLVLLNETSERLMVFQVFSPFSKEFLGLGVETESALFLQPGRETKQLVKFLFTQMEDEILALRSKPIKTTILNKGQLISE